MKQAAYNLCYLAACAVNGITPSKEKCDEMELDKLYKMSKAHSLSALAAMALNSAGVGISDEWKADRDKAVRKNILFDSERARIFKFMEENGVWYLPLKGIIMKTLYPKLGMREMSDNDILFDKDHQKRMMEFMKESGYTVKSYGRSNHDTYMKEPVFNFELHTRMFSEKTGEPFCSYYAKIKDKLIHDGKTEFGYRMTDEDFYIFMTAHEYKHYRSSGTGLRSLLDRYVYLLRKENMLDFGYIEAECRQLGIADFEREGRLLCEKVFASPKLPALTEAETKMLEYYMFSTTYGTMEQNISNDMKANSGKTTGMSKFGYIWRWIFPGMWYYKDRYPFAYKYKIFIPAVWFYRLLRGIFLRRKHIKKVVNTVNKIK